MELPSEDKDPHKDEVGLLKKTMYGTEDASRLFQEGYTRMFTANGYAVGKSNVALFYHRELNSRILVHGDDFNCQAKRRLMPPTACLARSIR